MILVNGDSFTTGEESNVAWPSLIPDTVNIAKAGASNDWICRTTVSYIEEPLQPVDAVILAWTSPSRIELGVNRQITPHSQRAYGDLVDNIYRVWEPSWAENKFVTQVRMMEAYLRSKNLPFVFISTFDIQATFDNRTRMPPEYLGWPNEGIVEWMGTCDKGPGGHPLVDGHLRIGMKIYEHIRNLGWVS